MNLRLLVVRAFDLPFKTLVMKGAARFGVELKAFASKTRAAFVTTRTPGSQFRDQSPRRLLAQPPSEELIRRDFPFLRDLNDKTLNHEFSLLGSGWVQVRRGLQAKGVEGNIYNANVTANVEPAKAGSIDWLAHESTRLNQTPAIETWKLIEKSDYAPIDWHVDFKSGFRWNPKVWWRETPYGHLPGIDIKVPWELARMQHLPALALEAGILKSSEPERAALLMTEARAQILDFVAQNSPLYGVNWRCAMDVGIRAANWVLAVDLFRANGFEFDRAFYEVLLASLNDHGSFIVNNLEKYPDFRANHYLANICGLAFIAAALPDNSANKSLWKTIGEREVLAEVEYQFHMDGSNFEASTSYHRLSGEMAIFTLALLHGEGASISAALTRAAGIGRFAAAISKPSGNIVQIGDTDSGRFFKFPPRLTIASGEIEENDLDHHDLVLASAELAGSEGSQERSRTSLAAWLINSLSRRDTAAKVTAPEALPKPSESVDDLQVQYSKAKYRQEYTFKMTSPIGDLKNETFSDFGVTIFKNENFFLSFRCGSLGQYGRAGHDHDDQLSIEIEFGGQLVIADPGTYLYTALSERRNQYRSVLAHFTPHLASGSAADLNAGLFYLRKVYPGERLSYGPRDVAGRCRRGDTVVYRWITIENDQVVIRDWCDDEDLVDLRSISPISYSRGYGKK